MRIKNLNKSAFSLLEVLLASIIFVLTIGGLFVTLNAVRTPVANGENGLTAAIFGKQVLESLRSQVNASLFYNACSTALPCPDFTLSLGNHQVPGANFPAGIAWPQGFAAANPNGLLYTVSCGDNSGVLGTAAPCTNADVARKVVLSVSWPDAT